MRRDTTIHVLRLSLGMLSLVAGSGCASPGFEIEDSTVVTIDARQWAPGSEPIDVKARARAAGASLGLLTPGAARPVEVLDVVDINQFIVRSNRGVERIQVYGIDQIDDRLPEGERRWLYDVALPRVVKEFRGRTLFDCDQFPFAGNTGYRVVRLKRPEQLGKDGHLGMELVEEGLARPAQPYGDTIREEGVLQTSMLPYSIVPIADVGRHAPHITQEARQALRASSSSTGVLTAERLQELGEQLLDEAEVHLEWTPGEPIRFVLGDNSAVEEELTRAVEAARAEPRFWEPDGTPVQAEFSESVHEVVSRGIEHLWAISPRGPWIHLIHGGNLTEAQLRYVLAHEIAHQYQEEVIVGGDWDLMESDPGQLLEAHAEVLAMQLLMGLDSPDDVIELGMRGLSSAYVRHVETLAWAMRQKGMTVDEFVAWAMDTGHRYARLDFGAISPAVWLCQEGIGSVYEGMTFSFHRDDRGSAHVEIRNHWPRTRSVQFDGWWHSRGSEGWEMGSSPPFNLIIDGESSVRIRWPRSSRGMVDGTEVVGSFTDTWSAVLESDAPN